MNRFALFDQGRQLVAQFCAVNAIAVPTVHPIARDDWRFKLPAYYRPSYINICLERCSLPNYGGRSWSWPGYSADRTPYGVLAHELGHHVDYHWGTRKQSYSSEFSTGIRGQAGEAPITSYCPNDAEWFAEMFRVFVTNSDLLRVLRPRTYAALVAVHLTPVVTVPWCLAMLGGAPERYRQAVQNKLGKPSKNGLQGALAGV